MKGKQCVVPKPISFPVKEYNYPEVWGSTAPAALSSERTSPVRSTCLPMSGQLTAWRTREADRLHRDANFRVLPHYRFPSLRAHVVRRTPPCDWPHEALLGPALVSLRKEQQRRSRRDLSRWQQHYSA